MDEETIAGAKDFENWMKEEEERMKNMVLEMPEEKTTTRLPMFRERPKIDRQLQLF